MSFLPCILPEKNSPVIQIDLVVFFIDKIMTGKVNGHKNKETAHLVLHTTYQKKWNSKELGNFADAMKNVERETLRTLKEEYCSKF